MLLAKMLQHVLPKCAAFRGVYDVRLLGVLSCKPQLTAAMLYHNSKGYVASCSSLEFCGGCRIPAAGRPVVSSTLLTVLSSEAAPRITLWVKVVALHGMTWSVQVRTYTLAILLIKD